MNRETMGHFAAKFDESCIVAGAKNAHESLNLGPAIVSFPDLSASISQIVNCSLRFAENNTFLSKRSTIYNLSQIFKFKFRT